MARKVLLEKLDETGMRKVYDEIEPLVFTLDSMEKWGFPLRVKSLRTMVKNLKSVSRSWKNHLAGSRRSLISIPETAGCDPFEKLGLPGGKKTKTGYSTAADILDKLAPDHAIVKISWSTAS